MPPFLREWKEKRQAELHSYRQVPEEFQQAMNGVTHRLWFIASKLASSELEAQKIMANKTIEVLQDERDEALQEIQNLENKISLLESDLKSSHEAKEGWERSYLKKT